MIDPPEVPQEITIARAAQDGPRKILGDEVLDSLCEINRIFLNALMLESQRGAKALRKWNAEALPLANLDEGMRAILAGCPFALFNARFQDGGFWAAQSKAYQVQEPMQRFLNFHAAETDHAAFTDLALFYAWHLVQFNPLAGRVLLGMSEPTVKSFRRLPLNRVQRLAAEHSQLVSLRWAQRKSFWHNLVRVAQSGAMDRLADVRLLGIQMMGAELAMQGSS